MNKLPWREVKAIADQFSHLAAGQKVRTNHNSVDCAGGSNSMLVERKDDNSISIHCFRCGGSGWFGNRASISSLKARAAGKHAVQVCDGKYQLPADCTGEQEHWPPQARVFIRKAKLTDKEVAKYEITYSPHMGRVIIPVGVNRSGANVSVDSYQARKVLPGDTGPKYLTYCNWPVPYYLPLAGETLVFTEDALSAIRVGRFLPAIALLGVKLQGYHIKLIRHEGYKKFLIFLDDDNYQVRKAQLRIKGQLEVFGQVNIIHNDGVDPKEMSDVDLKAILDEHISW